MARSRRTSLLSGSRGSLSRQSGKKGSKWGVEITGEVVLPWADARYLVRDISNAILEHHVKSIESGQKADGSGAQPRLAPEGNAGKQAARGERPNVRGIARTDGKNLADRLARAKIKGDGKLVKIGTRKTGSKKGGNLVKSSIFGTRASTRIGPDNGGHGKYLSKELQEGNRFLFADGLIERLVDDVLQKSLAKILDGEPADSTTGYDEEKGKDSK